MSEPMDVGQWAKSWEAMARHAEAAMSGNTGQSAWGAAAPWGAPVPPAASWFENMAQANPFPGGNQQSAAIEHLLAGAKGYLGMLQSLVNVAGGQGAPAFANPFAGNAVYGILPTTLTNNPIVAAMSGFGGQGVSSLDQMMEQFSSVVGPMFDKAKGALEMPAFGPQREKIENMQKTARVFIDYRQKSARYDRLMLKVGEQSFARFQLKLAEREDPGRQIDSARGLYDLWIDAAEEAYAEIALSEEFREVYAAVVDAQMRVRQQVQGEVEKVCNELGMPTRSEVNSIGERLQALRREFREEREVAPETEALQAEMAKLRRELDALKSAGARKPKTAQAAAAPKPATAAKIAKAKPTRQAEKSTKTNEAARAEAPVKKTVSTRKPRRKAAAKAPTARRKSTSSKVGKVAAVTAKSPKAKDRAAGKSGSFAASIARFARKSKTASATSRSVGAKSKVIRQGGSK